jgi:hypothetical protein
MEHLSTAKTSDHDGRATATMLPTVAIHAAEEPVTTGTSSGPTADWTRRSSSGRNRRVRRDLVRRVVVGAFLIVVATLSVQTAALSQQASIAVSPSTTAPGDTVTISETT